MESWLITLATLLALSILGASSLPIMARIALRRMVYRKIYPTAHIIRTCEANGEFPPGFAEARKISALAASPRGYRLSFTAIPGNTDKTCLFVHGVSWCWYGMAKYMGSFIERGWNVVALDLPGHGDSGGGPPSYGFRERDDVLLCADWAFTVFPNTRVFGVFGESMGAATALQYAPLDGRLAFVVADCPFTSGLDELEYRLSLIRLPRFLAGAVARLADRYARKREGFSLADASPKKAILETKVPILFMHGAEDRSVPASMSVAMYESRKTDAPTRLHLVAGARHARSIIRDPSGYRQALWDFLESLPPTESLRLPTL